jgi:chaperonin cofactor prefoldin
MTDLQERVPEGPPVRASMPNDTAVGAFRPVQPRNGLPRLMRRLIGVNEDILDWVPEERPRYTRLGFIVFNTGLLAALSMHMALATVLGNRWWLILPDLFWALIIMTVDSWLISSTHGAERVTLIGTYLPRLLLSFLLGITIAEPLVLAVFHQTISNEISSHRKTEIDQYESTVKRCNPPSGDFLTDSSCAGFLVTISERPQALKDELAGATTNRENLKTRANDVDGALAELERLARDECAGRAGPGLTAIPGEGPECLRNRAKADQFRTDNQVEQLHKDLDAADKRVRELTQALSGSSARTEREVNAAIVAMVEQKRGTLTDRGLLDEFDALGRLSEQSFIVGAAHVVLMLLLIALDCLPVLSKFMSGRTKYDERVQDLLFASGYLHGLQLKASETRDATTYQLQVGRFERKLREGLETIGGEDQSAKERRKIERDAQIERLAAALEREG